MPGGDDAGLTNVPQSIRPLNATNRRLDPDGVPAGDLIRHDKGAVRLWTKAVKRAGGNLRISEQPRGENGRVGPKARSVDNIHRTAGARPSGTSPEAAIRRLEAEAAKEKPRQIAPAGF